MLYIFLVKPVTKQITVKNYIREILKPSAKIKCFYVTTTTVSTSVMKNDSNFAEFSTLNYYKCFNQIV